MGCSSTKKTVSRAKIWDNVAISPCFYRLSIDFDGAAGRVFSEASPGQFVEIEVSRACLPAAGDIPEDLADRSQRQIILRRPFSFCDIRAVDGAGSPAVRIDVLYRVCGPGTLRMAALQKGDEISVIGPLGNGFSVPQGKRQAVLAAGGMGAGPILHLARILKKEHSDISIVVLVGAKTAGEMPVKVEVGEKGALLSEFSRFTDTQIVATDDGSLGKKGFVTVYLQRWLSEQHCRADKTIIYSCGPEPMLAEVAGIARRHDTDCQVSMERMMACGIGLCQSCAVETKDAKSGQTAYKLCCKDGPVFDAAEVVFGE